MRSRILFALCIFSFLPTSIRAQWLQNGTPVVATTGVQVNPAAVADGLGGVIFVWDDTRNGNEDIYAQRFNSAGVAQWTKDGVLVCTATGDQSGPMIIADAAGGAIITWYDPRSGNYDIYAQRISSSGVPQWTANGVALCTLADDQFITGLVTDGSGGAILSWDDERGGVRDVYARRITSAGSPQWTANGVPICTQAGFQDQSKIVSDGAGGAIIVWYDTRSGAHNYAQRVNGSGVVQWLLNGLIICNVGSQQNVAIASDGAGGAVFAWEDFRAISGPDIYAQRMNASGSLLWAADGVAISKVSTSENLPDIIWDNSLGLIATWWDSRNTGFNMYAQRLNAAGAPQWKENGILVSANNSAYPRIVSAGAGAGAIIAWFDADIRAQRVDAAGQIQWPVNGMPVTNDPGNQLAYMAMVSNGAGGAILAWNDRRSGTQYDIYAQRIDGRYGYWGKPEPTLNFVKDVPSDQGGKVRLEWAASSRDVLNQQVISHYSIWRGIDQIAFARASSAGVPTVSLPDVGPTFKGKAVRKDHARAVDYYWELIGSQDAAYRAGYSFNAATSFDSTAASSATHQFQIVSHANDSPYINWPSNILAGRSVDNVAPPPPLFLTAQRTGNYVYLKWNGVRVPDLDNYTVYRATSAGVTPIPTNFLADEDDTLLTDSSAPATALYYIVTASDIHQNRSVKSNEAAVSAATSAGNLPPITALTVLQNHPNPFSGETTFSVGLPAAADVSIEVYDVAGRRVRDYSLPQRAKGWSTIRLDGRDGNGLALPSGVYFYRVRAGVEAVTNKMVIAR